MYAVALIDIRDASRSVLASALAKAGFEVAAFSHWRKARTALSAIKVDAVVITDWRGSGGRGAHRYLRAPARRAPFVLVTDSGSAGQDGRFAAAVQYPAGLPEIAEAVKVACDAVPPLLRLGRWALDTQRRTLEWSGQSIDLTPVETELLRVLMSQGGSFVTSSDLVARAWGISTLLDRRVLYTHVAWLRRKLRDGLDGGDPIVSERQRGYRFDPGPQ